MNNIIIEQLYIKKKNIEKKKEKMQIIILTHGGPVMMPRLILDKEIKDKFKRCNKKEEIVKWVGRKIYNKQ